MIIVLLTSAWYDKDEVVDKDLIIFYSANKTTAFHDDEEELLARLIAVDSEWLIFLTNLLLFATEIQVVKWVYHVT